jgi:hypothetical protein
MAFGTLSTLDTLAASQQTIAQFGEDRAFSAIDAALQAHNQILRDAMGDLVETTTERLRRYGGPDNMSMDEVDEFGRGDAQKITAGATVGFPLRLFDISVQWTRKYFQNHKAAELAAQFRAALDAHRKRQLREIKRALFKPTNNTAYLDRLIDNVNLPLRALANADSQPIPLGPNGEVFNAATHTHYLARVGALAASDITGVLNTVREHYASGSLFLYINQASESAIRGFTSNFVAYLDARLVAADNTLRATGQLDQSNYYNRAIGLFDAAEVWVKPWIPANYMVAWIRGAGVVPLVFRERDAGAGNLVVAADDESYPLRARTMEAEFGVGIWNRVAAAILYTGGTSYVEPTITD